MTAKNISIEVQEVLVPADPRLPQELLREVLMCSGWGSGSCQVTRTLDPPSHAFIPSHPGDAPVTSQLQRTPHPSVYHPAAVPPCHLNFLFPIEVKNTLWPKTSQHKGFASIRGLRAFQGSDLLMDLHART